MLDKEHLKNIDFLVQQSQEVPDLYIFQLSLWDMQRMLQFFQNETKNRLKLARQFTET